LLVSAGPFVLRIEHVRVSGEELRHVAATRAHGLRDGLDVELVELPGHVLVPVIAQAHGYCLARGSELATGCDLVYMAEDAQMGYPAVRFGVPDMHFHPWFLGMRKAMEMLLTGDSISGVQAVERGSANAAYPADELEERLLEVAHRIALIPLELLQLNKRVVHRQMDAMGMRAGIRAGTERCALGTHTAAMRGFVEAARDKGLTRALQERDAPFGDYRTTG